MPKPPAWGSWELLRLWPQLGHAGPGGRRSRPVPPQSPERGLTRLYGARSSAPQASRCRASPCCLPRSGHTCPSHPAVRPRPSRASGHAELGPEVILPARCPPSWRPALRRRQVANKKRKKKRKEKAEEETREGDLSGFGGQLRLGQARYDSGGVSNRDCSLAVSREEAQASPARGPRGLALARTPSRTSVWSPGTASSKQGGLHRQSSRIKGPEVILPARCPPSWRRALRRRHVANKKREKKEKKKQKKRPGKRALAALGSPRPREGAL
eukprot:XP_017452190.1 PREDICTED: uncharacterized protein LOC691414 isoform X7 [Rattus norvegicus]